MYFRIWYFKFENLNTSFHAKTKIRILDKKKGSEDSDAMWEYNIIWRICTSSNPAHSHY